MAAPTPQTTLKSRATEAARNILQKHLSLRNGETVAFLHDEQGVSCANCFVEAARYLRIRVLSRYVPADKQVHFGVLSPEDLALLDQADAVLVCFAENLKTTAYRRQIVDQAAVDQRVLGSLSPSLHALAHAAGRCHDLDTAQRCDDLAQILLHGQEAEIISAVRDARGDIIEEHRLTVGLGGFHRAPATSAGPIHAGTWARLPAPEVTIAPMENTANGVFVLNGVFPGGVMTGSEHLLLIFNAGRLEMVGGNSPRVGEFWKVVESGKGAGGQMLGLSELGVRLWDLSTPDSTECLVPVGLGDNTALGGLLRSTVQELLLSRQVSLNVDQQPVLREGRLVYSASVWRESPESMRRLSVTIPSACEIRLTAHAARADAEGRLRVERRVGQRRVCSYRPGDATLGGHLGDLYAALTEQNAAVTLSALARQLLPGPICATLTDLRGLLAILRQHRLIEVREPMNLTWEAEAS